MNDTRTYPTGNYGKLPPQIAGPVTYRHSDEDNYEVLDGNGEVQIRVRGRELARQVSGLLQWFIELGARY